MSLKDSLSVQKTDSTRVSRFTPQAQRAVTGLIIVLFVGFIGGWLGSSARIRSTTTDNNDAARQVVTEQSELISSIAKAVGPSVVSVNVTSQRATNNPFFGDADLEQQSAGTGFVVSKDGYIVTNRHVIPSSATKVSVTLSDGTELDEVDIVGRTNANDPLDIAFLKVKDTKGKDLKPVKLGDSASMDVGDMVVAIGNALGQFQNTVTSGIVSGYGRSVEASGAEGGIESLQNLFQTDAAINQGNSGGPLVNANGEVIGINTAVAGNAENIGFAIPMNDVEGLIKTVLAEGKLLRPYLGVRYVMLTDDLAYQFNVDTKRGAYVVPSGRGQEPSVVPDSPAAKAGLQEKDIITKINGEALDENNSLISKLGRFAVGDRVTLTIIRGGQEQTVDVQLEAVPEEQ